MAFAEITFKNRLTKEATSAPVGYAYDFAILGPIALLLRLNMREMKIGGAIIALYIVIVLIVPPMILSFPLVHMILAACVNKCRIIQLIKDDLLR
jgi:hypothetical protein